MTYEMEITYVNQKKITCTCQGIHRKRKHNLGINLFYQQQNILVLFDSTNIPSMYTLTGLWYAAINWWPLDELIDADTYTNICTLVHMSICENVLKIRINNNGDVK